MSTSWKSLKESEKSNVRAFTVSIGDPVKWDSNPGTLGLISDVATSKSKITTTHIIDGHSASVIPSQAAVL